MQMTQRQSSKTERRGNLKPRKSKRAAARFNGSGGKFVAATTGCAVIA
jgi:hypothetical protein